MLHKYSKAASADQVDGKPCQVMSDDLDHHTLPTLSPQLTLPRVEHTRLDRACRRRQRSMRSAKILRQPADWRRVTPDLSGEPMYLRTTSASQTIGPHLCLRMQSAAFESSDATSSVTGLPREDHRVFWSMRLASGVEQYDGGTEATNRGDHSDNIQPRPSPATGLHSGRIASRRSLDLFRQRSGEHPHKGGDYSL